MGRISTISFPGLGIGEFTINGVALSFNIGNFPVTVMWYGIIICIGIFAGFGYFAYRARKVWISFDDILDITLVTVITAVIGARLYFVIFFGGFLETGGTFWENLGGTLYNIVAIWTCDLRRHHRRRTGGLSDVKTQKNRIFQAYRYDCPRRYAWSDHRKMGKFL